MFNYQSKEFFINMKPSDIPPKGHSDRKAFIDNEINKSIYGITVNGIFIPGGLYWEFNHWKIPVDIEVKGVIKKEILTPQLRDNSWIIHNAYEEATKQKKILVIGGARQISKTVTLTSLLGRQILLFENTNSLGLYSNTKDIEVTNAYLDVGLANVSEFLSLPVLDKDPKKGLMRIGFKQKDNTNYVYSSLYLRNTDEGKNTEIGAGLTLNFFAFDEIAKHSCAKAIEAVKPALISEFGWRCAPLFCFCVCAGTKVWNNNGELVNIEDISEETGIFGYDGYKALPQRVSWLAPPNKKECVKLHLEGNNTLECSIDHPILMSHKEDRYMEKGQIKTKITFKKANELVIGDRIAMIKEVPIFGKIKKPHARFLGMMIGDGSYGSNRTPHIGGADYELHDFLIKNYDVRENETIRFMTKDGKIYKSFSIRNSNDIFREAGIHKQVKFEKRFPVNVHEYDKESLAELIGGYYDADGNVSNWNKRNMRVTLTSICKDLLEDVKFNLLKFGINSNITYESRNGKSLLGNLDYIYRLYVNDYDSIINFQKNIKFLIKAKQDRLNLITTKICKAQKGKSVCSFVPGEKGKYFEGKHDMTGIRFQCLKKIEYIGLKNVYNITTNDTHTYIANGIITSNTGGNVEKSKDAENFFMFPEANNVLPFENEGKKTGLFIGGWYRQDFKRETSLSKYLNVEQGSELDEVKIKVTDFEKANTVLDQEQLDLSKDPDKSKLLKHRMYFPRSIQEMFLSESENPYPRELVEQQIKLLESNPIGTAVELYRDNSTKEVKHKLSSKLVNTQFPNPDWKLFQDAPIVIYDFPKYKDTYGLHFIGIDTYNDDEVSHSDSLGSIHVYRKEHADLTDDFRGCMVASYTGRPKSAKEFNEIALMLTEFYNGMVLYEHVTPSLLEYYDGKNKTHMLIDTYDLQKTININTKTLNKKGLKPTTANQKFLLNSELGYLTEELEDGYGIRRIYDLYLLRQYLVDRDKNTDAIISNQHAIAALNMFAKMNVKIDDGQEYEYNPIRNAFGFGMKSSSDTKKQNAFGI